MFCIATCILLKIQLNDAYWVGFMEDKIGSVERNLNAKLKMCQLCIKMWEKCTLLKIVVYIYKM